MGKVLLVMHRRVLAQSLIRAQTPQPVVDFCTEYDSANAVLTAIACDAEVALVEVAESGANPAAESLALCAEIRARKPDCKLLLLCPANSRKSRAAAVKAKRENQIDDFIFDDTSLDYLMSKLESLQNGGTPEHGNHIPPLA